MARGEGSHTHFVVGTLLSQEEQQRLAEQRLKEEQAKKAKEAAASKALNVTVDVQVRPVPVLGGALPHSPFAYKLRLC